MPFSLLSLEFFELVILGTLVIFASDCLTKNSGESFLLRKLRKEFAS